MFTRMPYRDQDQRLGTFAALTWKAFRAWLVPALALSIAVPAVSAGASLVSPVAVPHASGPAFPQGRANGNPPDPQYAAEKAIDGDPATFCCLLDSTLAGTSAATIPAKAAPPVTGHMVFDLGRAMLVSGVRITGRKDAGGMNPKDVDCFYFADDRPASHRAVDDLEHDAGIKPLARHARLPPLGPGGAHTVFWDGVIARYVGLRINDSYESGGGGVHYNYQIAEIQFLADPVAPRLLEARRDPSDHVRPSREIATLRLAIEDLSRTYPGRYRGQEFSARLDEMERQLRASLAANRPPQTSAWRRQLDDLKREALVRGNPLLAPGKLLFVKRYTYVPGWYYAEFMRASRFGGGLQILSLADGSLTPLAKELEGGIFDRFDLSFDARRVVFGYKSAPGKGFRLWEVGVDGKGLRQLTFDPPDESERVAKYWHPLYKDSGVYRHHTDDFHPCYLPDGGICLASTRCERGVLCDQSDSLAVNLLYRMNGDGTALGMLSQGALSESTPSVMSDGRILYTRWEYVDKGVIAVQALWAMRPDGSGTSEIYGNDREMPPVLIHGRAIPGVEHLFVATATMHHPFAVGPILLIDSRRDVRTLEPVWSLTPDTELSVEGKEGQPHAEHYTHVRGERLVKDDCGPLFSEPYPLADPLTGAGAGKYFLVTCNPDRPWHDPSAYGLWLIDAFGNRVPIYHDPQISCWQPVPLRPRSRPPIIPATNCASAAAPPPCLETTRGGSASLGETRPRGAEATVVLADVYAGLEGVPRGTIKYLRILEQVPRPWAARRFWPNDSAFGQHAVVSLNSHIHVKIHHGVVPVREDGSASFIVPAEKNLFFQALDADFLEVQRMRSFVDFRPGEVRSCVGCHEYRPKAPGGRAPLALRDPPQRPVAQPGETVPRPIHYPTDVQPILDRHCTSCHSGKRLDGGLDLSGTMTEYFSRSYESLMTRPLVAYIQEFYGPQPDGQITNVEPVPPRSVGSHASRLMTILRRGHYDVKMSPDEFIRLATWIDANGPYYGTYFGRRNWVYKDHPEFRPVPTLRSAAGISP
jgi:hypothetical protein